MEPSAGGPGTTGRGVLAHELDDATACPAAPDDLEVLLVCLADHGHADQVGSWMSPDVTNLPLTGTELLGALREGALSGLAAELNLSIQEYADHVAQEPPAQVDGLGPQGELPGTRSKGTPLRAFAVEEAGA
ncbi:YidB family protein [Streptomyces sp. NPDC049949]|uniref:YidB family protein n=1 Tax=Streptomyces sp. NPDC049949 TaxID=3154627 RepID=UPI00343A124F